jgi:hypothetical protein
LSKTTPHEKAELFFIIDTCRGMLYS